MAKYHVEFSANVSVDAESIEGAIEKVRIYYRLDSDMIDNVEKVDDD